MKKLKLPLFITFEGGEGAGKTTLINCLKEVLENEGYSVIVTREPGGSRLGDAIRDLLLHRAIHMHMSSKAELFLFLSARAQHVEEVIRPSLQEDKVILCDRFSDSSLAYQGYARGLGMEDVEALTNFATDDLKPDLTFFLDVDPEVGLARASRVGKPDRIEEQKLEFHKLVREAFIEIAKREPKRVKFIDASKTQEEVLKQTLEMIHHA